jgi:hypothetical protein
VNEYEDLTELRSISKITNLAGIMFKDPIKFIGFLLNIDFFVTGISNSVTGPLILWSENKEYSINHKQVSYWKQAQHSELFTKYKLAY